MREAAGRSLVRGNVSINLSIKRNEGVTQIRLNEAALSQVLAALDAVRSRVGGDAPRADQILACVACSKSRRARMIRRRSAPGRRI